MLSNVEATFVGRPLPFSFPVPHRTRVESSSTGEISLRQPRKHASGPNLVPRNDVAHVYNRFYLNERDALASIQSCFRRNCIPI
jgi:hypothetical protein